jgi:TolA-binding protein
VSSEVAELAPTVQEAAPQAERRDKLAEEEALLEQARHALRSEPRRALSLLRQHQSQFPDGQLAAERMYLMVGCLARLGQRAEARRHADALLRHYPKSVYARRAPRLLGDVE